MTFLQYNSEEVSVADMQSPFMFLIKKALNNASLSSCIQLKFQRVCIQMNKAEAQSKYFHSITIAWLYMELCKELLPNPHTITRRKLFGIYLHALTSHAPLQYEIVSQE